LKGARRQKDLFELFPDLPRPRHRSIEAQRERVLRLIAAARERAAENARLQRAFAERIRETIRWRRTSYSTLRATIGSRRAAR